LLHCSSPEQASMVQSVLQSGKPHKECAAASLTFSMLYDDGQEVKLLQKKGGNLADRLKVMEPAGNVEQGLAMPATQICYDTARCAAKDAVKPAHFQFDTCRFPWNAMSDKKGSEETEEDDCLLEIGLKFATNVTSTAHMRAHNKRRFMWKVDLALFHEDGTIMLCQTTKSPPFAYLPRNPERSSLEFRLDEVVCEGRPMDIMMCAGSGLGVRERPEMVARLRARDGVEYTLGRDRPTKSTFVARLPMEIKAGCYHVQLINDDEVTEEEELLVLTDPTCFDLEEFARDLEAEQNRSCNQASGSGSIPEEGRLSPSWSHSSSCESFIDYGMERMV